MTQPSPASVAPSAAHTAMGVGIDTSRYGHHASFLRSDLQPAAADLDFAESAAGYQQLRERLQTLATHFGPVHFHFRLDVAGAYADNLLAFLQAWPEPKTISCGEPQRNKNYRTAVFGHKKSDPIESAAAARYALTEKPQATPVVSAPIRLLGQVAGRLEAQTRQCTRLVNQLHHLLARVFPELALVTKDLGAGWVLKLLRRYPTAAKLAAARPSSLEAIPYLPHEQIPALLEHARASVASLTGPLAEQLVRDQVRQVREAQQRQKTLEKLLVQAYRQLPQANHLASIKGIGEVTAAVLTAKIVDIRRFATAGKLVGYFGVFPVQASSGLDREGKPRAPKRYVMCPRGSDLVRRYLYLAALTAAQHNPAVQPLYQRVRAKHLDHPAIAVGHAMRKLLHLVYAVWKTDKPFDPEHDARRPARVPAPDIPMSQNEPAAGHNPEAVPDRSVVTAADSPIGLAPAAELVQPAPSAAASSATPWATLWATPWLDFGHLKNQLPLLRVLEHLGWLAELRGRGPQRRGPCPVHADRGPQRRGRTFSVHLDQNVFHCFDAACAIQGDVIDLWAALKKLPLRGPPSTWPAPSPSKPRRRPDGTEKRYG